MKNATPANPLDYFNDPHARSYEAWDGERILDLLDGYAVTENARPTHPDESIVAFRVAYAWTDDTSTWVLSQPMQEWDAIEIEHAVRARSRGMMQTQLRPVWGRKVAPKKVTSYVAPSYDKVAVGAAFEATKYFMYVAENDPSRIAEIKNTVAERVKEVACTDYGYYAEMCARAGIPSMKCRASLHAVAFHHEDYPGE